MQDHREVHRSFFKSRSGSILPITAVCLFVLFGAAGLAVDYSRITTAKSALQNAADAAALALASESGELSKKQVQARAEEFFSANSSYSVKIILGKRENNKFSVTISSDLELFLMPVLFSKFGGGNANSNYSNINVYAESVKGEIGGLEIVLLIDNTASMKYGNTWPSTVTSVNKVLSELEKKVEGNNFYITIIPYTDRVNIGKSRQSWLAGPGTKFFADHTGTTNPSVQNNVWASYMAQWEGCVEPLYEDQSHTSSAEFPYRLAFGDPEKSFVPTVDALASGVMIAPYPYWGKSDCADEIIGPTSDLKTAIAQFKKLSPGTATGRFDDALTWGWRAVSSRYRGSWSAGSDYPSNSGERRKIVALFTDARTNINMFELEEKLGEYGSNKGSKNLFKHVVDVCRRMKLDGVIPYIFQVPGNNHADKYFKECAGQNHYKINSTGEFSNVLGNLSNQTEQVRLVK